MILNIITSWDTRRVLQQAIFCEIPPVIQLSLHFFLIRSRFDYCEILSLESCSSLHTKSLGMDSFTAVLLVKLFSLNSFSSSYFIFLFFKKNVSSFLLGSVIQRSVCMWIIWNPKNASRRSKSTNTFYFSLRYLVYCCVLIVPPPLFKRDVWTSNFLAVVRGYCSVFQMWTGSFFHETHTGNKNIVCLNTHSCKSEKWMQECLNQWKL